MGQDACGTSWFVVVRRRTDGLERYRPGSGASGGVRVVTEPKATHVNQAFNVVGANQPRR